MLMFFWDFSLFAGEVSVAVAVNFIGGSRQIATLFE
jgi:hypothetical protein